MDKIVSNTVSIDETINQRIIQLSGSLTLNKKEFRIDDEVADEIFISVKFMDDGLLSDEIKQEIGEAVMQKLKEDLT